MHQPVAPLGLHTAVWPHILRAFVLYWDGEKEENTFIKSNFAFFSWIYLLCNPDGVFFQTGIWSLPTNYFGVGRVWKRKEVEKILGGQARQVQETGRPWTQFSKGWPWTSDSSVSVFLSAGVAGVCRGYRCVPPCQLLEADITLTKLEHGSWAGWRESTIS